MTRKAPTRAVIKKIFALSGNECAFPECAQPVVNASGKLIAQICHIEAAEKGGERYNPQQTDDERAAAENLIIFCPNHHEITNDVARYTVLVLQKMKLDHETKFLNKDLKLSAEIIESAVEQMLAEQININQGSGQQFITKDGDIHHHGLTYSEVKDLVQGEVKNAFADLFKNSPNLQKAQVLESVSEPSGSTVGSKILDPDAAEIEGSKYKTRLYEAKSLLDEQKFKSAQDIYLQLLKDFEADGQVPRIIKFKVYNNLGVCQRNLGDDAGASISFKLAFSVVSSIAVIACKNRAVSSLLDGKPLDGIPFIDAAIAMAPEDKECLHLKATLLSAGGSGDGTLGMYGDIE